MLCDQWTVPTPCALTGTPVASCASPQTVCAACLPRLALNLSQSHSDPVLGYQTPVFIVGFFLLYEALTSWGLERLLL